MASGDGEQPPSAPSGRRTVWRRRGGDPPRDAPVTPPGRLCVRLAPGTRGGGSGPTGDRLASAGGRGRGDLDGLRRRRCGSRTGIGVGAEPDLVAVADRASPEPEGSPLGSGPGSAAAALGGSGGPPADVNEFAPERPPGLLRGPARRPQSSTTTAGRAGERLGGGRGGTESEAVDLERGRGELDGHDARRSDSGARGSGRARRHCPADVPRPLPPRPRRAFRGRTGGGAPASSAAHPDSSGSRRTAQLEPGINRFEVPDLRGGAASRRPPSARHPPPSLLRGPPPPRRLAPVRIAASPVPSEVAVVNLSLPASRYGDDESRFRFMDAGSWTNSRRA